ncbi:PBECR4 domain-containing protein [Streptococcus canis]|uniref:PBECR4 domain-containing protein n=2 Tax=Streptococcus canis TaxID=1329 RepID=UPI002995BAFF|nr:PBECR4 domain-containing protein [Streptococcus canis]
MTEKTWNERVEYAGTRSILEVAADLNMELFRQGKNYRWKEHDSLVITPSNNLWKWFSKEGEGSGGDVIELVKMMKEVDFNQAVAYLNTGDFKQVIAQTQVSQENFHYYLAPYEQPFDEARQYLKEERGLSDDTIDFFYHKGVLAQANAKVGDDIEPVLVFKNLDENGQVVGASLQGLVANPDKYFGRGYLKQIMKNSQPYNGMHVDIGTPNRLVFAESSIDLMSYYELHKDSLSDVRLVSLEGLKTGTMGRHLVQLEAEMKDRTVPSSWDDEKLSQGLDEALQRGYFKDRQHEAILTLAVDNDPKGKQLIQGLKDKGVPVIDATPPKREDQSKMDWNGYLKQEKEKAMTNIERTKKAPESILEQEKMTGHILGDLSETTQKAAPLPEANKSQPLNGLLPNQTQDQSFLHFTLKDRTKSRTKQGYHAISNNDLNKVNHYALGLQQSAKWYRDNLANATIHYFYKSDNNTPVNVQISFEEKHFMHLTGLFPIKDGQTAEKTLHDFADGRGEFDNLMIANKGAAFQKLQVLPDLQGILEVNSFYFDDVSEVPQLNKLQMESAIKSDDHDLVTAFRSNGENSYPASLMELTDDLLRQFDQATPGNTMLGIFREREGQIEQIAVNSSYVKDGGQEMLRLLQTNSYQEGVSSPETTMAKYPLSPKSKIKEGIQRQAKEAMTDLAVSSAEKNKGFDYHKASAYELSQQAIQDIKAFTESPEDLKAYLDFMSRFPQLSPRNAALIQAQWPGANAVATFKQWQELGKALDLGDADVISSKRTYTNKRTGESKEVVDHNLSVKAGEKSQITLFRPVMVAMIPVLDDKGKQVINQKGNPKFKPLSQATPEEKALVKAQKLKVSHFQDVDATGNRKFMTYKVFELSQTTLKPESYPKAMPNRHYDFNLDQVKTKEVLQGLQDYANYLKVSIATDGQNGQDKQLGSAKGAFYPLEQRIVLNPNDTQGEKISTTIHELAHATLHNPQLTQGKQNDLTKTQKELEAEMTSYLVSKHFGLDTAEKAIPYMAKWTNQLKGLTDEDLSTAMTRVHKTVARMVKSVEAYTQPYALKKSQTRPQVPVKKPPKDRNL